MKAKIEKLMVFLIPTDQVVGDFSQSMIKSDKLLADQFNGFQINPKLDFQTGPIKKISQKARLLTFSTYLSAMVP
jgi:hypothetical protein